MSKAVSGHRPESAPDSPRSRPLAPPQPPDFGPRLLEAQSAAQMEFARSGEVRAALQGLLGVLLELTGSTCGVIGEVLRPPEGPRRLRPLALANTAWEPALPPPAVPEELDVSALHSPLSTLVTTGEPMLVQTRGQTLRDKELLPGLPLPKRFLGLPCKAGDELVGVVGLGDAADGYAPELVGLLQPVLVTCVSLLLYERGARQGRLSEERLRAQEEELRAHRLQMDELIQQRTETLLVTTVALEERQAQLMHAERMASLGQLVAGIAHEINNPLGYITSNLATLTQYLDTFTEVIGRYRELTRALAPGLTGADAERLESLRGYEAQEDLDYLLTDVDELLNDSREGAHRVADTVQSLKAFVREDSGQMELVDVNKELATTLKVVWNQLKYRSEVKCDYGQVPPILGRPAQLNQVFTHLLLNAVQALSSPGVIGVSTRLEGEDVLVCISDTGQGMTPDVIEKIFTPFFTTKPPGKGAGLGLSISSGIVARHMGRIEVHSQYGQGSTFTVRLPVASDP
jgi:two-component system, NtrC family, sensor kinase